LKNKIIIPTIALIAIVSIGGFAITAGAFLNPNIALATKSNDEIHRIPHHLLILQTDQ
jgi:hypothetical protein